MVNFIAEVHKIMVARCKSLVFAGKVVAFRCQRKTHMLDSMIRILLNWWCTHFLLHIIIVQSRTFYLHIVLYNGYLICTTTAFNSLLFCTQWTVPQFHVFTFLWVYWNNFPYLFQLRPLFLQSTYVTDSETNHFVQKCWKSLVEACKV